MQKKWSITVEFQQKFHLLAKWTYAGIKDQGQKKVSV